MAKTLLIDVAYGKTLKALQLGWPPGCGRDYEMIRIEEREVVQIEPGEDPEKVRADVLRKLHAHVLRRMIAEMEPNFAANFAGDIHQGS